MTGDKGNCIDSGHACRKWMGREHIITVENRLQCNPYQIKGMTAGTTPH